jgi:uncharacterized protein (UPF0128 family)
MTALQNKIVSNMITKKEELNDLIKAAANEGLSIHVMVQPTTRPTIAMPYPMVLVSAFEEVKPQVVGGGEICEGEGHD